MKALIPVALALAAGAFALNNRLAAIEKSVAVIEWRLDHSVVGPAPWKQP